MKAPKASITSEGNELSRFSDTPGDASLEDLFHPLDKTLEEQGIEASTLEFSSDLNHGSTVATDGRSDLAKQLRDAITQKQTEIESGKPNSEDLLHLMLGVLKEDSIEVNSIYTGFKTLSFISTPHPKLSVLL